MSKASRSGRRRQAGSSAATAGWGVRPDPTEVSLFHNRALLHLLLHTVVPSAAVDALSAQGGATAGGGAATQPGTDDSADSDDSHGWADGTHTGMDTLDTAASVLLYSKPASSSGDDDSGGDALAVAANAASPPLPSLFGAAGDDVVMSMNAQRAAVLQALLAGTIADARRDIRPPPCGGAPALGPGSSASRARGMFVLQASVLSLFPVLKSLRGKEVAVQTEVLDILLGLLNQLPGLGLEVRVRLFAYAAAHAPLCVLMLLLRRALGSMKRPSV